MEVTREQQIKWSWDPGFPFARKGDAAVVGSELHRLATLEGTNVAKLRVAVVVAAAREPSSPLHAFFEWDQEAAAYKYNCEQGRKLIGGINYEIVNEGEKEIRCAWGAVTDEGGTRSFQLVPEILKNEEKTRQLIGDCVRYLEQAKKRFADLTTARRDLERAFGRLDNVIDEIREIQEKMTRPAPPPTRKHPGTRIEPRDCQATAT